MFSLRDRKSPREEIAKLTATYVNGMAIGIAVVGGIAPSINVILAGGASLSAVVALPLLTVGCTAVSIGIHLIVRRYLQAGVEQMTLDVLMILIGPLSMAVGALAVLYFTSSPRSK